MKLVKLMKFKFSGDNQFPFSNPTKDLWVSLRNFLLTVRNEGGVCLCKDYAITIPRSQSSKCGISN